MLRYVTYPETLANALVFIPYAVVYGPSFLKADKAKACFRPICKPSNTDQHYSKTTQVKSR